MRRQWVVSLTWAALLLVVGGVAVALPRLSPEQARRRTADMLAAIPWTKSLDEACRQAAREHKLVFWLHMLGRLDGYT